MQLLELSQDNRYVKVELPPPFSPSKSWYNDNAGVEEVIFVGTVGVVKVLEDISVKSCFNFVLDIIHQCRYCTVMVLMDLFIVRSQSRNCGKRFGSLHQSVNRAKNQHSGQKLRHF